VTTTKSNYADDEDAADIPNEDTDAPGDKQEETNNGISSMILALHYKYFLILSLEQ
jgi:hypothetical protein